jgi:hypothetical protein
MKKRLVLVSLLILAPGVLAGCEGCEETLKEVAEEAEREAREQAKKAVDDGFDAAEDAFKNVRDKLRKSDSVTYAVPPSDDDIEKALSWAEKWVVDNREWPYENECLTFVKRAYTEGAGLPKFVLPADGTVDTATKARERAQTALKAVEKPDELPYELNENGLYGGEPPPGAWVYYTSSDPRGHVALSLGGGKIIHAVDKTVKKENLDLKGSFKFKGWSWLPPSREAK